MAKVFLSYDRDDTERARPLALALERAGHSVWWDLHIRGGEQYTKVIDEALKAADAVVVLWSRFSVDSAWVRDEAAAGRDSGRLVPAALDDTVPPLGFRQFQTIDLSLWRGRGKPPHMIELLASIEAMATQPMDTQPASPIKVSPVKRGIRFPVWAIGAIAAAAILVAAIFIYQAKRGSQGVYTVAVTAADNDAQPLARDLIVNLARLQSAQSGSLRLVGPAVKSPDQADLVLEIAEGSNEGHAEASLLLMLGKDRSILWSKDFEQPSGKLADLKQQIAFTAARVLGCAFESFDFDGTHLKPQTLKTYLTGCSQVEEVGGSDPSAVIPIMRNVIADAPRFTPAWATLLLVQAEVSDVAFAKGLEDRREQNALRKLIVDARKIDPDLAEATLAEMSLLPWSNFQGVLRLADKAASQSPDNPFVLNTRSNVLRRVGRMEESIDDAQRAATLDPLSPIIRDAYISALFYGGRFEAARQELAKAEQLWPGTDTVQGVKFRYHLRYGDPREALKMAQAGGLEPGVELFLNARIEPDPQNLKALKEFLDKRIQGAGGIGLSAYIQSAGEFGWEEDVFAILLNWPRSEDLGAISDIYFRPTMKKFRSDPRFMQVAKRAGLLGYWQRSGNWPDFCSEPGLPYDCKKEAAELGA